MCPSAFRLPNITDTELISRDLMRHYHYHTFNQNRLLALFPSLLKGSDQAISSSGVIITIRMKIHYYWVEAVDYSMTFSYLGFLTVAKPIAIDFGIQQELQPSDQAVADILSPSIIAVA